MSRTVPEWVAKHDDAKIPGEVRLRIWNRAKGHCQICTRLILAGEVKHFDHIKPLADGGGHREGNLQIACVACHKIKTGEEATERAKVRSKAKAVVGIKDPPKLKGQAFSIPPSRAKKLAAREGRLPVPGVRPMFAKSQEPAAREIEELRGRS